MSRKNILPPESLHKSCPACGAEALKSTLLLRVPVKEISSEREEAVFGPEEETTAGKLSWCGECEREWTWSELFYILKNQKQGGARKKCIAS